MQVVSGFLETKADTLNKEWNIKFYIDYIDFYKFSVTGTSRLISIGISTLAASPMRCTHNRLQKRLTTIHALRLQRIKPYEKERGG